MTDGDKLLRCREAAAILGCSVGRIRSMIHDGRLKAVLVGETAIRVRESAVLRCIRDLEPAPEQLRDGDVIVVDRRAA